LVGHRNRSFSLKSSSLSPLSVVLLVKWSSWGSVSLTFLGRMRVKILSGFQGLRYVTWTEECCSKFARYPLFESEPSDLQANGDGFWLFDKQLFRLEIVRCANTGNLLMEYSVKSESHPV
jgi:hypothetical protein